LPGCIPSHPSGWTLLLCKWRTHRPSPRFDVIHKVSPARDRVFQPEPEQSLWPMIMAIRVQFCPGCGLCVWSVVSRSPAAGRHPPRGLRNRRGSSEEHTNIRVYLRGGSSPKHPKINTLLTALSKLESLLCSQRRLKTVGKLRPIKIKIFKQSVKMQSSAVKKDTWPWVNGRSCTLKELVVPILSETFSAIRK